MIPKRSKAHLAFIRSLPCCVSGRTDRVEPADVGRRGMGQKCSDLETIPLNALYHAEQHRIGLRAFCRTYDLNLAELVAMLTEKPYVSTLRYWNHGFVGRPDVYYVANYRKQFMRLAPVSRGLGYSIKLLKDRVREILSNEILKRTSSRMSREA
jgi:hypothetical protein